MTKTVLYYLVSVLSLFLFCGISPEYIRAAPAYQYPDRQIPSEKLLLLNGRIWHNRYSKAFNDQFFLSGTFLRGSVTFRGRRFDNLDLKYDIANDELILNIESHPVISMNKEMVDSFTLVSGNRIFRIINAGTDTGSVLKGYVNVLYAGPTTLFAKYTKKLQPLALDGLYDLFAQEHSLYLRKGEEILPFRGKRQFLGLLGDKKRETVIYIKTNKIKINHKDPGSFVPVLMFYDSISK